MRNVQITEEKGMLVIRVDLKAQGQASVSGKSTVIASTEGNQPVGVGLYLGLNLYKKN